MRTWSIAGFIDRVTIAIVDAQAFAAVAVQSALDAAHTLEQLTRPVRRDVRDRADQLADKEAEIDAHEPNEIDVRLVGFTSCGQDMESYARGFNEGFDEAHRQQDPDWSPDDDGPNPTVPGMHNATDRLCVYTRANGIDPLAICGVCRPVRDIVEQMIEERFGSQVDKADKLDAEMWRAVVGMYSKMDPQSTPAAGAAGSSSPAACDIPPVARRGVPPWSDLADRMVEHLPSAKELPDEDYRPLYGEKRCATCGYWRGQHVAEDYSDDSNLCCPLWDSATTFTPLDRKHLK